MKGKKLIVFFLIFAIILGVLGYFCIKYLQDKQVVTQIEEYVPEEEITEEQERKTMVNLYFYNNETDKLDTEARIINTVELIENPYIELVQLLIDGPKSEKLNKLISNDVVLNNATIKDGCVIVDFSIDLLNYTEDEDLKNKIIDSIVNTLTELTEVDSVKIIIDGKENGVFDEIYVRN